MHDHDDRLLSLFERMTAGSGWLGRASEAVMRRLVPTVSARAGFFWRRECQCGLIIWCPPTGGCPQDKWCYDILCEFDGGHLYCYPETKKNEADYCGGCTNC